MTRLLPLLIRIIRPRPFQWSVIISRWQSRMCLLASRTARTTGKPNSGRDSCLGSHPTSGGVSVRLFGCELTTFRQLQWSGPAAHGPNAIGVDSWPSLIVQAKAAPDNLRRKSCLRLDQKKQTSNFSCSITVRRIANLDIDAKLSRHICDVYTAKALGFMTLPLLLRELR